MTNRQIDEEAIFHFARDLTDTAKRSEYLQQVCGGDQELRERIRGLLDAHEKEQTFLKSNVELETTAAKAPTAKSGSIAKPGEEIGRFKLLQQIGEGGFGVVFMAEQHKPIRRKVALKVIKPGMDTKGVVARFEAERQALAMMDHPNIAKVLDGGTTDSGRPYFVMELVRGVPITDYCDNKQLSADQRLELFITVCKAIQHAHQKGIIHRDLKPSNILVALHDGKPVVKVIDFGVAKAVNQQLTDKTLYTAFGQMVGTPQYMSPEQAEISGLDIDTRSDVYSLGVILYELLTGSTPLETDRLRKAGYAEIQRLVKESEPQRPSTRLSTSGAKLTAIAKHRSVAPDRLSALIKGDLDWVVMKALEKDRNRRYSTPVELADDVNRYLTQEPVEAYPPSRVYKMKKFVRRNRGLVLAASAFAVIMITATTVSTLNWRVANTAR
ncbi:serine/threonine protein kinase, partial [bacterium]|nr:serine/threonine protein kinase [bacterium]